MHKVLVVCDRVEAWSICRAVNAPGMDLHVLSYKGSLGGKRTSSSTHINGRPSIGRTARHGTVLH